MTLSSQRWARVPSYAKSTATVVLVTNARIREDLAPEDFDWITALRNHPIKQLAGEEGPLQPSLFEETNLAEVTAPDYPGERLMTCRNPELAEHRTAKREALLAATEQSLAKIERAVAEGRLKACGAIGRRVEKALARYKMAKHFHTEIDCEHFRYWRDEAAIAAEDAVCHYKALSQVEQAFRFLKNEPLPIRPVYHDRSDRVRAHVFLCLLAYDVTRELRRRWAPLLYGDEQPTA